ncbi:YggT family protein [Microbacterium endophyticum]|uniref:YggT family protein n=1 Tax=Microbacterium endophyticum TaxID=1526412 RepID=UPI0013E9DB27|nr:YggT family protein [Microbacterium endophyticum]NIK36524.1 YggT family protein [Microbacterium endophyticum]
MEVLRLVASIANVLLLLYVFTLFGRLILEYIPIFNREWRPRGASLVAAEVVYTLTDPPIKLFRRFIPPLRVGMVSIDLAFALTMLVCFVLLSVTRTLAAA